MVAIISCDHIFHVTHTQPFHRFHQGTSVKSCWLVPNRLMWFCPLDGTLLQVRANDEGTTGGGRNQFYCCTCPYSCTIKRPRIQAFYPARKQVDDILGGAAAWENVDRTMVRFKAKRGARLRISWWKGRQAGMYLCMYV